MTYMNSAYKIGVEDAADLFKVAFLPEMMQMAHNIAPMAHNILPMAQQAVEDFVGHIPYMASHGLGFHTTANAAQMAFRNSKPGLQYAEQQTAQGYQHAAQGKKINPALRAIKTTMVGPETMENYEVGHAAGMEAKNKLPAVPTKGLVLPKEYAGSAIGNTHAGQAIPGAVNEMNNPTPQSLYGRARDKIFPPVDVNAEPTLAQRIIGKGIPTIASLLAPSMAPHFMVNRGRQMIANSTMGRNFMKNQFKKGFSGARAPSKLTQTMSDFLVSPAALDTRRAGQALQEDARSGIQSAAHTILRKMSPLGAV